MAAARSWHLWAIPITIVLRAAFSAGSDEGGQVGHIGEDQVRMVKPVLGRRGGVAEDTHTGGFGCLDAGGAVLDHHAPCGSGGHGARRVKEQVWCWFAVRDLVT